ncbi:hypothetical protein [Paracoccus sp. SSK6]|uniref:hypothetical protein n=1 Tax=Paracoccus sp. SSK6 TaxID=3143131 RepID=UPI00321B6336
MNIDTTALTTSHAKLAFARDMKPVIETFLARAAAEGMSLSRVRGDAVSASRAQIWFEYDDAGRRAFVRFHTYHRRGGLGVRLQGEILYPWRKTGHDRFINSRGLVAKQIPAALSALRAACSSELEARDRRLKLQSMLRGAGFEEGVSFCGIEYERDGLAVEERNDVWHITIPACQATEIIAGIINQTG